MQHFIVTFLKEEKSEQYLFTETPFKIVPFKFYPDFYVKRDCSIKIEVICSSIINSLDIFFIFRSILLHII